MSDVQLGLVIFKGKQEIANSDMVTAPSRKSGVIGPQRWYRLLLNLLGKLIVASLAVSDELVKFTTIADDLGKSTEDGPPFELPVHPLILFAIVFVDWW